MINQVQKSENILGKYYVGHDTIFIMQFLFLCKTSNYTGVPYCNTHKLYNNIACVFPLGFLRSDKIDLRPKNILNYVSNCDNNMQM